MSKRDYYEVLGISRSASAVEIKSAFRKLAVKHHPDKNPGDEKAEFRFKEINEAYQILHDGEKRAAYDQMGHAAFESGGGGGRHGFGSMPDIFEDIFGSVFGGGRRGPRRGADLRYDLEISLEEAFYGKTETLTFPALIDCETCSGTGAKEGSKPVTCASCGGSGMIRMQQGFFTLERTCASCRGKGVFIKDPCPKCSGSGRMNREKSLNVKIPAGVDHGTRIRLSNEGEADSGGAPGDLYVFISIKKNPFYEREGPLLVAYVPISMTSAALGATIKVPAIDGSECEIRIPAGTQTGKQFRLTGRGMPILRSKKRGDFLISITVETPQNLTPRQRELLKEFDGESSETTHPETEGFFSRLAKLFG